MYSITAANARAVQGSSHLRVVHTMTDYGPFSADPGEATRENFKHLTQSFQTDPTPESALWLGMCATRCRLAGVVSENEARGAQAFALNVVKKQRERAARAAAKGPTKADTRALISKVAPKPAAATVPAPVVNLGNVVDRQAERDEKIARVRASVAAAKSAPVTKPGADIDHQTIKFLKAPKVRVGHNAADIEALRAADGKTVAEAFPTLRQGYRTVRYWARKGAVALV